MAKEFNLYKSRKGSYAVTASELHDLLDFNPGMFTIHIKRWLKDSYIFENDIRRPIVLKDFSVRLRAEQKGVTDYFLSLPFHNFLCKLLKPVENLRYLHNVLFFYHSYLPSFCLT